MTGQGEQRVQGTPPTSGAIDNTLGGSERTGLTLGSGALTSATYQDPELARHEREREISAEHYRRL